MVGARSSVGLLWFLKRFFGADQQWIQGFSGVLLISLGAFLDDVEQRIGNGYVLLGFAGELALGERQREFCNVENESGIHFAYFNLWLRPFLRLRAFVLAL